jgi:gluconolactonase
MDFDRAAPGFGRIVQRDAELEVVATDVHFGEGPVWNRRTGELFYVSILGDTIWKWQPGVGKSVVMHPCFKADGMTFDREGRLVVAGWARRSVWRLEHDGSLTTLCSRFDGQPLNTPNDIVVKSDGAIYFTDPSGALYNVEMHGEDVQRYMDYHGVFRIAADGQTTLVVRDFAYPNGLAFSPDETRLYINDTREYLIKVYDVGADGSLHDGRVFAKVVGEEPGVADGMKCDLEGNVYCTGPAGVHVFDPSGRQLGRIRIPGHTTNFCWGDDDWRTMYFTTYTTVFRLRLGIPGVAVG